MNPEKPKTFNEDIDTSLEIAASGKNSEEQLATVYQFPVRHKEVQPRPIPEHIQQEIAEYTADALLETKNTKKNRLKKALATVTMIAVGAGASIGLLNDSDGPAKEIPTQTEIATPDDTLWEMTDDVKNVDDKRPVIDWAEKNSPDLEDKSLDVGDKVVLPVDAKDID